MIYLLILLSIFCLFVLSRHFLLLNDLKKIQLELQKNQTVSTNKMLTSPHNFKELNHLLTELNRNLASQKVISREFRDREQRLKEQMTNISHDLRTPLASILGYLELLKDVELSVSEQEKYLKIIEERAVTLKKLMSQYYQLAQLETAEPQFNLRQIEVNLFVRELLTTYYSDFQTAKIDVLVYHLDKPFWLLSDSNALTRIFTNLIENVLRYGVNEMKVENFTLENETYTRISNQFLGDADIDETRVFERLYAANKERNSASSGIGLTVVEMLLTQLGYEVRCQIIDNWFVILVKW